MIDHFIKEDSNFKALNCNDHTLTLSFYGPKILHLRIIQCDTFIFCSKVNLLGSILSQIIHLLYIHFLQNFISFSLSSVKINYQKVFSFIIFPYK